MTSARRKRQSARKIILPVDAIRLDFQPPECLIKPTVQHYVEQFRSGKRVRPIRVRFDGESYFLEDGFHRLAAARRAGLAKVEARVLPGALIEMEARFGRYLKKLKNVLAEGS